MQKIIDQTYNSEGNNLINNELISYENNKTIINNLKMMLDDSSFIDKHRVSDKCFQRNRVLTFKVVILLMIDTLKKGVQTELNDFFGKIDKLDVNECKVSAGAFTQARAKLKYTAFCELDQYQCDAFYSQKGYKLWNGFRLVAIDGSTLRLPFTEDLGKKFGTQSQNRLKNVVLARISEAFDPLNHIIIDAAIDKYRRSEHDLMVQHLEKLRKGDLAIYDRGYPGFWIYKYHYEREIDFCFRVSVAGKGKYIEEFVSSGELEKVVDIKCTTKDSKDKCKRYNLDEKSVKCRLLRVDIGQDEPEILVTSLLDNQQFPHNYFKELYHLRWPVEENYKLLKHRIELENFSGKTVHAIMQDFFANIFLANLTTILVHQSMPELERKTQHRKWKYKINWSNAIQNMKKSGVLLFIRDQIDGLLDGLYKIFLVNPVSVRPERTYQRKKKNIAREFSMSYK